MKKTKQQPSGALSEFGKKIKKKALLSRIILLEAEVKRLKDAAEDSTKTSNVSLDH